MNPPAAQRILDRLQAVAALGQQRAAGPGHAEAVRQVKAYQSRRFARTYADLIDGRVAGGRYAEGARFFLNQLYGPQDFSARDAQFARIVPALVRLFPAALVDTVAELAELHALSETLDHALAAHWLDEPGAAGAELGAPAYAQAWQAAGQAAARERQIVLTLDMMSALERHTRHRLLRVGLKAMRGAAQAAGLGALQQFLEQGFDTFGGMGDTRPFQALVAQRERALVAALFHPDAPGWLAGRRAAGGADLGALADLPDLPDLP